MRTLNTNKTRWAILPVAGLLLTGALAGCGNKSDDTATTPTTPTTTPATTPMNSSTPTAGGPSTPGMNPSGTPGAAPGGPGGTMMNKPSENPNGATGDAVITAKVKSAIIADTKVGATGINVDTKSGTVVLKGEVSSAAAKEAAVADAKKMQGVKNVIDQMTVKP